MKSSESKLKFTFINNDLDSIRLNPNLKGNDHMNSAKECLQPASLLCSRVDDNIGIPWGQEMKHQ